MNNIRFLKNLGSSKGASDPGIASKLARLPKILDQRPISCHGRTLIFKIILQPKQPLIFCSDLFCFKDGSTYIAQTGLELEVLLGS